MVEQTLVIHEALKTDKVVVQIREHLWTEPYQGTFHRFDHWFLDLSLTERPGAARGRYLDHWGERRHEPIGDVRGMGLLIGVELVRDHATRLPANDEAEAVMYEAMGRGLSFKVSGGNVLTLTPPLVISREQMGQALDILDASLAAVGNGAR